MQPGTGGFLDISDDKAIVPESMEASLEAFDRRQTILRVNGAAMGQVGDFYRIVPIAKVTRHSEVLAHLNS